MKKIFIICLSVLFCLIGFSNAEAFSSNDKLFKNIASKLPKKVFLREVRQIPGKSGYYLGIYIKDYKIEKREVLEPGYLLLYSTCPEQPMGQSIYGQYHLFLYAKGKIIDDKVIPSPESDKNNMQSLSYFNTKENIYEFFGGAKPQEKQVLNLAWVPLIKFQDLNGDKLRNEFLLTGENIVCGHVNYLVAGYNPKANKVVVYNIRQGESKLNWYDNFKPNKSGNVEVAWSCGDHGTDLEEHKKFNYDKVKGEYMLVDYKTAECEE